MRFWGAVAGVAFMAALGGTAHADLLTVQLNDYASTGGSAVYGTSGVNLAKFEADDSATGGVDVTVTLENVSQYFASTGGGHITVAFNLKPGVTITQSDLTFTTNPGSGFTLKTGISPPPTGLGTFTDGIKGGWTGTSNHFAGPIEFHIDNVSVSDFVANAAGYWAVADVLATRTGSVGGKDAVIITTTSITPGVPEASTWAMLLAGFGGLGLMGYRKARGARAVAG